MNEEKLEVKLKLIYESFIKSVEINTTNYNMYSFRDFKAVITILDILDDTDLDDLVNNFHNVSNKYLLLQHKNLPFIFALVSLHLSSRGDTLYIWVDLYFTEYEDILTFKAFDEIQEGSKLISETYIHDYEQMNFNEDERTLGIDHKDFLDKIEETIRNSLYNFVSSYSFIKEKFEKKELEFGNNKAKTDNSKSS